MSEIERVVRPGQVEREERWDEAPPLGSWFWYIPTKSVTGEQDEDEDEIEADPTEPGGALLTFVRATGSNFVELEEAPQSRFYRMTYAEFFECATPAPDAMTKIAREVDLARGRVQGLLGKVAEITHKLGIGDAKALPAQTAALAQCPTARR